jgi:hypothetical protein
MMNELGKYYEIHQKKVWEVYAYSDSDAIALVMDGFGSIMEDELFVDKTSEAVNE